MQTIKYSETMMQVLQRAQCRERQTTRHPLDIMILEALGRGRCHATHILGTLMGKQSTVGRLYVDISSSRPENGEILWDTDMMPLLERRCNDILHMAKSDATRINTGHLLLLAMLDHTTSTHWHVSATGVVDKQISTYVDDLPPHEEYYTEIDILAAKGGR